MRRPVLDRVALLFAILAIIIFLLAWGYVVKNPRAPLEAPFIHTSILPRLLGLL